MRFITLAALLLSPALAFAGVFDIPPTDKSVNLLGTIFGSTIGSIYLGGAPNPALSHMFELLNVVVVSLGSIIVSYIGIISLINTAQEGTAMGKKWSSVWIPLRSVCGMVLIAPTPASGYSVIQASVMWLILQGVGAADQVWNSVLADFASGISIGRGVNITNSTDETSSYFKLYDHGETLAKEVLNSAVCMYSLKNIASGKNLLDNNDPDQFPAPGAFDHQSNIAKIGNKINFYSIPNNDVASNNDAAQISGTAYVGVRNPEYPEYKAICGSFPITASVKKDEWPAELRYGVNAKLLRVHARDIYQHKLKALKVMFNNLEPLAREIVAQRVVPRDDNNRLTHIPSRPQPAGFKRHSINSYVEIMHELYKPQHNSTLTNVVNDGTKNGWISAGAFYWLLNRKAETMLFKDATATRPYGTNIPTSFKLGNKLESLLEYNEQEQYLSNRLKDAALYYKEDIASVDEVIKITDPERNDNDPRAKFGALSEELVAMLKEEMNQEDLDPLISQGKFGTKLMILTENYWLETWQEGSAKILDIENKDLELTEKIKEYFDKLQTKGALAISIYGTMWTVGATLAIYVPLVPYMMFTIAAMGWLLLVVEAIVAAPILSLGFVLPSGDELGKIAQGIMLLLNIILRPTLMLFGFILATRLYSAVIQLVNFSISGTFDNLDALESKFAFAPIIVIYGAFILALANKCFALIYALPDKILRWIGGAPEHTDGSQEMQVAKGGLSKGADTINKISQGFADAEFGKMQDKFKSLQKNADAVKGGPDSSKKPGQDESKQ